KVVLVTGPVIDKVAKAINYLREFLRYFEGVGVEVFEVSEIHNFTEAISKIKDLFRMLLKKYDYVIVNLSGGMRALIIEVLTAIVLLPKELKDRIVIELDTEDGKATIEIPRELSILINPPDLGVKEDIIKALISLGGEADIYTLAQRLNKDETTIRRQLESLKELRLIELTYRPLKAKLKDIARLLVA
ncbi:MAG TPA: CRISPR locus-related DNA-binding protein, partial [Acidilobales archaeon]|nr:CRISPR locus-related DNA-binding protein [Acidilobales archaeon]